MQGFKYSRPASVEAAIQSFKSVSDGRYLAGGQTLIPVLKQRLAAPLDVIDPSAITGLAGISAEAGLLTIGAMTRHADVAGSEAVGRHIPALAELALGIGDPQVRNRGTIGGSVANNDPAADYPAGVLGLGATIVTDRRRIAADNFFQGLFTTALEEGEMIKVFEFPIPERAGYVKFAHPASRYALVGVMVSKGPAGVRVAVTGAGSGVFRLSEAETALSRTFSTTVVAGLSVPADDLISDMHASADYRAHLIGVLTQRAVARAAG